MGRYGVWPVLAAILVGCAGAVVPPEVPVVAVPLRWSLAETAGEVGANSATPDCFGWWQALQDPILTALMQRAAEHNRDLQLAHMRVEEARAQRRGASAALYPHVDGSVAGGYMRLPKDLSLLKDRGRRETGFFEMGFDAEWELDIFGAKSLAVAGADYTVQAHRAGISEVWISLAAEVARNYVELRGYQQRLVLLNKKMAAQDTSVALARCLVEAGLSGSSLLDDAEKQLHSLRAGQPTLLLAVAKAIHRLGVLVGNEPQALAVELAVAGTLPCLPEDKPVGIPAELLQRRPDIRRAERELAAAQASHESATAEQWPKMTLRGFGGLVATQGHKLFSHDSTTWLAAPTLTIPFFNSQQPSHDADYQAIQQQQARYRYEKVVLEALEETENSLAALQQHQSQSDELRQAWQMEQNVYQTNQDLYHQGFIDYRSLLARESASLEAEEAYLQSYIALLVDYIALYKSLAGGWHYCP